MPTIQSIHKKAQVLYTVFMTENGNNSCTDILNVFYYLKFHVILQTLLFKQLTVLCFEDAHFYQFMHHLLKQHQTLLFEH